MNEQHDAFSPQFNEPQDNSKKKEVREKRDRMAIKGSSEDSFAPMWDEKEAEEHFYDLIGDRSGMKENIEALKNPDLDEQQVAELIDGLNSMGKSGGQSGEIGADFYLELPSGYNVHAQYQASGGRLSFSLMK